jgi:hypothetical protein
MNIKFEHTMMSTIPTIEFGSWLVTSTDCKPSVSPMVKKGDCYVSYSMA